MYSDFKARKRFLIHKGKRIILLFGGILWSIFTLAQMNPVSVSIMVAPPYTSSISDYMTIPNKITV
ncbi:MAG TPA: hypothetical protein PKX60_00780, partial [Prolixibacteraceae bacterium]|nr:hypothetical protein [Prolixibacteraceae bacterium]